MYHFIGLSYLPNVLHRRGLWCRSQLCQWEDDFDDDPSKWGHAEKAAAFGRYISCSVNPPMGMLTKQKRPVLVKLDPSIVTGPGVVFIGKWSSFADVLPEEALRQSGVEWFDKMFLNDQTNHCSPHPGEFLVPQHIPLDDLLGLVFYSDADQREGLNNLVLPKKLDISVQPWRFGRKMQQEELDQ